MALKITLPSPTKLKPKLAVLVHMQCVFDSTNCATSPLNPKTTKQMANSAAILVIVLISWHSCSWLKYL